MELVLGVALGGGLALMLAFEQLGTRHQLDELLELPPGCMRRVASSRVADNAARVRGSARAAGRKCQSYHQALESAPGRTPASASSLRFFWMIRRWSCGYNFRFAHVCQLHQNVP